MHRMYSRLARLLLALGMLALFGPWLLLCWSQGLSLVSGRPQQAVATTLRGVTFAADHHALSLQSLRSGAYQRAMANGFTRRLPFFETAVRVKNQVFYSLLGTSPLPYIVIGRKRELYETIYLDEYCSRNIAAFQPVAEAWVRRLGRAQRWYTEHGKVFLYVITPSKASILPQYIPRGWTCPAPMAERLGFLQAYDAILRAHGVNFVDTSSLIAKAKPHYPLDMFPRGGTHWNAIASAISTQAIIARINALHPDRPLGSFDFSWRRAQAGDDVDPEKVDHDLLDLFNLVRPDNRNPVPALTAHPVPQGHCNALTVADVGGSFMFEINDWLVRSACPPKLDFWTYWQLYHVHFPGRIVSPAVASERQASLMQDADIVLLEENEQMIARSNHGPAFIDMLTGAGGRRHGS